MYHQFRTADAKTIFVGVTSDKQWERLCRAFDRPDLAADPRLASNDEHIAQREWLLPTLRELFAGLTLAQAVARCEEAELPLSPVARPEDLLDDAQLRAGGSLLETTFPAGQHGSLPTLPFRLGNAAWTKRADPSTLGQHTAAVLASVGYGRGEIAALAKEGVVVLDRGS